MSINTQYKKYHTHYVARHWWLVDPYGFFTGGQLERRFQPKMMAELNELHAKLYPRRKKINLLNLPEAEKDTIRTKWQLIAMRWLYRARQLDVALDQWLNTNANDVVLEYLDAPLTLRTSSTSTYNSQGSGRYKYAKNVLLADLTLLQKFGFTADIVEFKREWGAEYNLMGNCEPYILAALQRRGDTSLLDWVVQIWRNGSNPKVYNPWLDDTIYEQSMRIAMGGSVVP